MTIHELHNQTRSTLARPLSITTLTRDDRTAIEQILGRADQLPDNFASHPSPNAENAWIRDLHSLVRELADIMDKY